MQEAAALHIQNALVEGALCDLFMTDHFASGKLPGAVAVDLGGLAVWPGLINAHDHLALNHYPRSRFRPAYDNAHEWGEEMNARLRREPYRTGRAYPLADRVWIGGLKNLLCGALTVVHHNPLHPPLEAPYYPVRVLRRYGWAHSLHFERDVVESYLKVTGDVPWIIHLAEGVDDRAALEYGRLKKLGCAQPNTVLVHGVGLTADDMLDSARRVRGLVWCPSSNRYLLGYTANVELWQDLGGRVALGSDSRLTADGDLLDEMRAALQTEQVDPDAVLEMVTHQPATIFDVADAGSLDTGMRADWFATRAGVVPAEARRADLVLVVRGGIPQIGLPEVMARFPHVPTVQGTLDGQPRAIHAGLAARLLECRLVEPGLTVEGQASHSRGPGVLRWIRAGLPL